MLALLPTLEILGNGSDLGWIVLDVTEDHVAFVMHKTPHTLPTGALPGAALVIMVHHC